MDGPAARSTRCSSTSHRRRLLGGAPIGSDPLTAVCDEANRVFGYPGLYVIDGSAVPVNLGVNPALTISALAEHAMSQIPAAAAAPQPRVAGVV